MRYIYGVGVVKKLKKANKILFSWITVAVVAFNGLAVATPLLLSGTAHALASPGDVWITAAMPNPTGSDTNGEYITIQNQTSNSVNLSGWTIADNAGTGTLSGTLAGNASYKICRDSNLSTSTALPCDAEWAGMDLVNTGDTLTLKDGSTQVDQVSYTSSAEGVENTFSHTPSIINITNVFQLESAIENQADGQTWNIQAGNYGLIPNNTIEESGQTGWYFPITANNITINGIGNPTIYGNSYSADGAYATQDLIAIFGNNVKINDLTLMPKMEPNKTIEVLGNNSTIENTKIEPNTLTSPSEISSLPDPNEAQWGGSIYYNNAGGTQTLSDVTINNGGISDHSPSATLDISNVNLDYSTNVDWINSYRFATHGNPVNGTPVITYHVSSALNNLDDVLANIQNGDTVDLDSNITTSHQATVTKSVTLNGNGYTLNSAFTKTTNDNNSAIGIQSDGVTVNNLVVDGTGSTNLHGINVYESTGVNLNNDTIKNFDSLFSYGLVVNGSKVIVNNLTTDGNFASVDVDQGSSVTTPAVLTVDGTSHHNDSVVSGIYVDNSTKNVSVVDTNNQYAVTHPGFHANDELYVLKPPVPTAPNSTHFLTNTNSVLVCGSTVNSTYSNKLQFVWDSTSSSSAAYRTLVTYPDGSTTWAYTNSRNVWLSKTAYTDFGFGEHGTGDYSYQVQARNSANQWSPLASACNLYYDTQSPTASFIKAPANNSFVNGDFQVSGVAQDNVRLAGAGFDVRDPHDTTGNAWRAGCVNGTYTSNPNPIAGSSSATLSCTINTKNLISGHTYYVRIHAGDYAGYGSRDVAPLSLRYFTYDTSAPQMPTNLQVKYQYDKNYINNGSVIRTLKRPGPYMGNNLELTWKDAASDWVTGHHILVTYPDRTTHLAYQGNNTNNWLVSQDGFGQHGQGKYTFRVVAVNPNGSTKSSETFSLYYVSNIPTATFKTTPPKYANGSFQITVMGYDTTVLQDVGADVRDSNGVWVAGCTNGKLLNGATLPDYSPTGTGLTVDYTCTVYTHNLVNGQTYTLRARAGFNEADGQGYGNVNADGNWQFTYDTSIPTGLANLSPSDGTYITTANLQKITWKAANDPYDPLTYYYESSHSNAVNPSDGSLVNPIYGPVSTGSNTYINTANTSAGTYYWNVKACDASGNCTKWTSPWEVIVDNTAPNIPTVTFTADDTGDPVSNGGYTNSKDFTFGLFNPSSEGVVRYQLKYWNAIPGSPFNGEPLAWSPTNLSSTGHMSTFGTYTDNFTQGEGTHYFEFSACDAAGNCSPFSKPYIINYDATPPSEPGSPTATSPTNNDSVNWVWTAANDNGTVKSGIDHYVYWLTDSSNNMVGTKQTTSSLNATTNVTSDGVYTMHVEAVDGAGNIGQASIGTVTVDTALPAITMSTPTMHNNVITPVVTATDPASDSLTYSWTADTSNPSGATISNTGVLEPDITVTKSGNYKFTLTATDQAGNSSTSNLTFGYTVPANVVHTNAVVNGNNSNGQNAGFTNVATTNSNSGSNSSGNSDGHVLGLHTNTPSNSSSTSNNSKQNTDKVQNSKAFLGLGWWWLLVLAVVLGLLRTVFGKLYSKNTGQ